MKLFPKQGWYLLVIALVFQCIALIKIAYVDGTPIGTMMFMDWRWPEARMLAVERGAAWTALICALILAWRQNWIAAAMISGWFALIAITTYAQAGSFGAPYAPVAHAARYTLPLLVVAAIKRPKEAELVARWAIGLTFVAHGLEAWALHPRFVDYIIAGFQNVLGIRVTQFVAEIMLRVIGVVDVIVGVLVVWKKWRWVVMWMAIWGGATAMSRMIHLGFPKWPATFLRAAHVAIPLALYLCWHPRRQEPDGGDSDA